MIAFDNAFYKTNIILHRKQKILAAEEDILLKLSSTGVDNLCSTSWIQPAEPWLQQRSAVEMSPCAATLLGM